MGNLIDAVLRRRAIVGNHIHQDNCTVPRHEALNDLANEGCPRKVLQDQGSQQTPKLLSHSLVTAQDMSWTRGPA